MAAEYNLAAHEAAVWRQLNNIEAFQYWYSLSTFGFTFMMSIRIQLLPGVTNRFKAIKSLSLSVYEAKVIKVR